jgi:hypothetical protein
MRTIELYRKHKAGEVSREKFLYEVRRDKNLPWVTNVTSYDDAVKILKNKGIISEAEISENYEVHYSDGVRQAKKFKDINQAMSFAKSLISTNDKLQHVDVFKAGPNFNSTADTNAVVAWWGDGSFMDNKSKNDPKLAAKKMSLGENEIDEISAQTKYNAAMKAVNKSYMSDNPSDIDRKKAVSQGNKFISEIDPVLKKTVIDFGNSLGFETKIEKSIYNSQYEPVVQILMGKDLRNPEIRVTIRKNTDSIEGGQYLPDEAAERRLGNLIKQIQKKELDVELGSGSLNEADANIPTDPSVDRVNPYFLKRGVQMLLAKEKELTNDSYIKALNKAASMLKKNPHAFDEEMFANAKDVEKADAKLETEEVKKANHNNKANEMKKVKVKSLKESAIEELTTHLKKKELVNEDSHWKHHVGSEVHTPDGQGKVIEIVGGTFTVEMEDGTQKDYQINTVDHHTQKAQEENVLPAPERKLPDEDKPLDPSYKMNKDGQRAINPKGLEFRVGDEAIAVDNDQKIKIDSFKQSQGRIKAGFSDGINYRYIDIDGLEKPAGDSPWAYFKGRPFGEAVKQYIAKYKDDKEKMGKLKEAIKKLKEAGTQITPAGGNPVFVKTSEVPNKEKELRAAGITNYTKKTVG